MSLSQEQKNLLLAERIFDQIPDLIYDLVRENVDASLPQKKLNKQYDTVMNYITENIEQLKMI
jgi:hypothetical protein